MAGKQEATSLPTMLGKGDGFAVGEHSYRVLPLKLKDVDEFTTDSLSIGAQLFNLVNPEARAKVEKWLQKQVRNDDDKPLTLAQAMTDDWDVDDLKNCLQKLAGLSG